MKLTVLCLLALLGISALALSAWANQAAHEPTALVAVASNFAEPAKALAAEFERKTGTKIEFSFGATGKHYAQIANGAPFDAFLSADEERPAKLESEGKAAKGTRFTYAVGRLALWSAKPGVVDPEGKVLRAEAFKHLAIAKPELAPYGAAAKQTLEKLGAWSDVESRLVFGENIAQTFQFVQTGNAELGFVAWSQLKALPAGGEGSHWLVPATMHDPIKQDAVLLRDNATARDFLAFLRTEEARKIIAGFGYDLSEPTPASQIP